MRTMLLIACAFGLHGLLADPVSAQTMDHLTITIQGLALQDDGGAQPRVGGSGRGLTIGESVSRSLWKTAEMCGLSIAPTRRDASAILGWTVQATPIKVIDDAVTFRLEWMRDRDRGRDTTSPGGTMQLTLRPGEIMPVDIAEVPATSAARVCSFTRAELTVGVDYFPPADIDRRVVAADVWLARQAVNGSQQGMFGERPPQLVEQVRVRGQFNRPIPFYFSTLTDGGVSLDFYGDLTIKPRDGLFEATLVTRSRLVEGGRESQTMPVNVPGLGQMSGARKVESTFRLKPDEVVSVELPRLSENASGAFADQAFSITIRARQLR